MPDAPAAAAAEPISDNQIRDSHEILADDPYRPLTAHEEWSYFLYQTHARATFLGAAEDTVYTRITGGFVYCCGIGAWGQQYAA